MKLNFHLCHSWSNVDKTGVQYCVVCNKARKVFDTKKEHEHNFQLQSKVTIVNDKKEPIGLKLIYLCKCGQDKIVTSGSP